MFILQAMVFNEDGINTRWLSHWFMIVCDCLMYEYLGERYSVQVFLWYVNTITFHYFSFSEVFILSICACFIFLHFIFNIWIFSIIIFRLICVACYLYIELFYVTWVLWGGDGFPHVGDGPVLESLQDKHMLISVHHLEPGHNVQISALLLCPVTFKYMYNGIIDILKFNWALSLNLQLTIDNCFAVLTILLWTFW